MAIESFDAETFVRNIPGTNLALYERKRGPVYRCKLCHVGFSGGDMADVLRRYERHMLAQHLGREG